MRATRVGDRNGLQGARCTGAFSATAGAARAETMLKAIFNGWPDDQVHPLFAGFEAANPDLKVDV